MNGILRLLSRRGEPSRRMRRLLVVLAALGLIVVGTAVYAVEPRESAGLMLIAAVLAVIPLASVSEFRRNVLRRANADERETQRRNDAYRVSYRIVEFGFFTAFLVALWGEWVATSWTAAEWSAVWLTGLWFVIFLPYFVFAWREPDAAPD